MTNGILTFHHFRHTPTYLNLHLLVFMFFYLYWTFHLRFLFHSQIHNLNWLRREKWQRLFLFSADICQRVWGQWVNACGSVWMEIRAACLLSSISLQPPPPPLDKSIAFSFENFISLFAWKFTLFWFWSDYRQDKTTSTKILKKIIASAVLHSCNVLYLPLADSANHISKEWVCNELAISLFGQSDKYKTRCES